MLLPTCTRCDSPSQRSSPRRIASTVSLILVVVAAGDTSTLEDGKLTDETAFEDPASLEFFSEKNDASLLVFGSTSKKRPHTLTFTRTFGAKVLDMLELHLDPDSFRQLSQFKGRKFAVGLRPMIVFAGTAFESPTANEYTMAKSMFIDFFKGDVSDKIDVEGLQYIVSISAEEPVGEDSKPVIHLRVYLISTKRSGQTLPRVEGKHMNGPSFPNHNKQPCCHNHSSIFRSPDY